jgi:type IV pilus assembly protein PilC
MPSFEYKAIDKTGQPARGGLDAVNEVDLELRLRRMGLDLITCKQVDRRTKSIGAGGAVTRQDLINFCFDMEQMVRSGIPILDGLRDMRDSIDSPRFREVLTVMTEDMEAGNVLSQCMSTHTDVFDRVFISLIRAGEDTGNLPGVLQNLVDSLKWQDELASQTKKLIMYPAFLGFVVVGVTFFMMIYLVPKMAGFIKNMGQELPLQTQVLMATSDFFVNYWYVIIITPILLVVASTVAVNTNSVARYRFDALKLRIPYIGEILRKIILSRFSGIFAMLYASGIPVLESIRTTQAIVGNLVMRKALERVEQSIREGHNVAGAFNDAGIFPPLVVRMLRIGESTGGLDKALLNVSYFYNRDVKEAVGKAQTLIEPMLTLFMGALLGWIMLSVIGPIYDVISKIKT